MSKLRYKNICRIDIRRIDLSGQDLSGQNLSGRRLRGANLSGANLSEADLSGADLRDANLANVNLTGARLDGAFFDRAELSGVDLSRFSLCPESGSFVGYKPVKIRWSANESVSSPLLRSGFSYVNGGMEDVDPGRVWYEGDGVVELEIPAEAARVSPLGSIICRASAAKIVRCLTRRIVLREYLSDSPDFYREVRAGNIQIGVSPFEETVAPNMELPPGAVVDNVLHDNLGQLSSSSYLVVGDSLMVSGQFVADNRTRNSCGIRFLASMEGAARYCPPLPEAEVEI